MQLSKEEVLKIAQLARISLSDEQVIKYQKELSAILSFVNQIQEVNTENVLPTSQVTNLENVQRQDEVSYNFSREDMLASAIEQEEQHLKVKNVF